MEKSKMNPFDAELLVMITDITKMQPDVKEKADGYDISVGMWGASTREREVLEHAVKGRIGSRLKDVVYLDAGILFQIEYDNTEYPENLRTGLSQPFPTAGDVFLHTTYQVDAIQVKRNNLDRLLMFTGGGTMTTERTINGQAVYSFVGVNGIYIDAPESWFIVREPNGRLYVCPEKDFTKNFQPKQKSESEIEELFNKLFGTNIDSRIKKLTEEYEEFIEASNAFIRNPESRELYNAMVDELSDLNALVFHISQILGVPQIQSLRNAYDKVCGRQFNPDYKRTHPHEIKGCAGCLNFTTKNEKGYCNVFKSEQSCGKLSCQEYKSKNDQI